MSATDILRQQGVDPRVIAKFDEKQKERAKRAGLVAGGAGGLAAAGTGASLVSAGRTGAKNARYDIKNVRADRPANAGLRLKAAGRVVRNASKLKRTGGVLVAAGALGAGAAGHKLHQEYAGKTLAKLPRHPVEKGYTAGQMSILRQQGLDPISKASFIPFIENAAGATGAALGIGEARKKKRKKVAKADKRRDTSGAAIAGAGGATAGVGLVGGGIPGVNSKVPLEPTTGSHVKRGSAALKSARGGIFGFRADAHKGFLKRFEDADQAGPTTRSSHFLHGHNAGKIGPEKQIIRHMKIGRAGSNVALVGGGAAAAYGVHRMNSKKPRKRVSKAKKDTDRYFGAALGGGSALAAGSVGGSHLLEHQGRKWSQRSADSIEEARKIVPKMGGSKRSVGPNHRVPDVRPDVTDGKIARDKKLLNGYSSAKTEAAGKLRGNATQQRYFAGIYGKIANTTRKVRNPALAAAAVGGGGLLVANHRRKPVRKSLVNGKWLKSSEALAAYKKGLKPGGYGKAKGMTPAHAEIKEQTEAGSGWMKTVQQNPQKSQKTLGLLGLHGLAVRTGGKSSGKSTVLLNPQAIARNSGGKRDYRKNLKMVRTHEEAHAQPKRSQYRSHQLNSSDKKMGREEGRADYLSQGHHSGYKSPLERSYLDNAPNKEFGSAYKEVQDKMHAAGTKVRKEFPRA